MVLTLHVTDCNPLTLTELVKEKVSSLGSRCRGVEGSGSFTCSPLDLFKPVHDTCGSGYSPCAVQVALPVVLFTTTFRSVYGAECDRKQLVTL